MLATARSFDKGMSPPRLAMDRKYRNIRDRESTYVKVDPVKLVQNAHEKERLAFRFSLEQRDFPTAYRIYREFLDTQVLNAAEVTSLVQMISADALSRKTSTIAQPDALKTVLWQIVKDVQENRVAYQSMIWVYILGALQSWGNFNEAHTFWEYLQTLPMRNTTIKKEIPQIDSRAYGAMIKLMVAEGRPLSECRNLYQKALEVPGYQPSLLLDEAMVQAHFAAGDIGGSYKLMDKALADHRSAIRPGFFNAIMGLALDADAVGIAIEVFMKACSLGLVVNTSQIGRLLHALASMPDTYDTASLIVKKYRWLCQGRLPVELVNALLNVTFVQGGDSDLVLRRVRKCLKNLKKQDISATIGTVNTLLGGYIALGEEHLVKELLKSTTVGETSYRTMLKALARLPTHDTLRRIKVVWAMFEDFRCQNGTTMETRDLAMVMRAASHCGEVALDWVQSLIEKFVHEIGDEAGIEGLHKELAAHRTGIFVHGSRAAMPPSKLRRSQR